MIEAQDEVWGGESPGIEINKCYHCGSKQFKKVNQVFSDGRIHLRIECNDCGQFIKFGSQKPNDEFKGRINSRPDLYNATRVDLYRRIFELEDRLGLNK